MNIELTTDQVHNIVAEDLKVTIKDLVKDPYPLFHDTPKALNVIVSMLETLEHYTTRSQFEEFYEEVFPEILMHIVKEEIRKRKDDNQ